MLYEIRDDSSLEEVESTPIKKEIQLEALLSMKLGEELHNGIFGEKLLFLGKQFQLGPNLKSDMIALDEQGRCVVIELKRDTVFSSAGIQSLGYLGILSHFKGEKFLNFVTKNQSGLKNTICNYFPNIENINNESRIILIGKAFNPTVFSLGNWLTSQGVPVKCISYRLLEINKNQYLSFSTEFLSSNRDEYVHGLHQPPRKPAKFWHILGSRKYNKVKDWEKDRWEHWKKKDIITLGFDNVDDESCPGYKKMNDYIKGDEVFIWASGSGLIGHCLIDGDYSYKKEHKEIPYMENHGHTIKVEWKHTVKLNEAIKRKELNEAEFSHPIQSKQRITTNVHLTKNLIA